MAAPILISCVYVSWSPEPLPLTKSGEEPEKGNSWPPIKAAATGDNNPFPPFWKQFCKADSLAERAGQHLSVLYTLANEGGYRFTAKIEEFLFRIVQQACENAYRHAQANTIRVSGEITQHQVAIRIEDDGVGFVINERADLPTLLAQKHFGLVEMYERAAIIGADLQIKSAPKQGTQVKLLWNPSDNDLSSAVT